MGQKLRKIQSVFNKGELSPRLKGRVDNKAYYKAYDTGQNFLPFPEGSGTFRPATVYVNEVKDSTKATVLVPFRFSTVQNYVIEFGDQYVRFYRNRGLVESGGSPYEVVTPYLEADLRELYFFQSADVLYILHPDYQPRQLIRTSDTSWSLDLFEFVDGPYENINDTATTFAYASGVVTASTNTFTANDVGRMIRIKSGSAWRYGTIDAYTSATEVDVTLNNTATISATTSWRLGVFGGSKGWPSVGTIYEERMILGNTAEMPSSLWASVTGDFDNFAPSNPDDGVVADDNGFARTINNDQVNAINWLSAGRILLIGTTGGEYSLTGGSSSGYAPITPSNVTIKRESNYGSKANIEAQRIGNAVLYPSESGTKVREIYYEFGIDSYVSRDTTLFNEHILSSPILEAEYCKEPDPYYWTCLESGELVGMVYERTEEVEGWHKHLIGGEGAKVESLAVIPRPQDEKNDLWMIVSRTINGATKRYVEYMSEIFEDVSVPITGLEKRLYAKYLDSCISYDGYYNADITLSATSGSGVTVTASASVFSSSDVGRQLRSGTGKATVVTFNSATEIVVDITSTMSGTTAGAGLWCMAAKTFSGADHLEGETVSVQADGAIVDSEVVSSGSITLDEYACVVHIGFPYTLRLKLLPPEEPQLGTIRGREIAVTRMVFYVTDTYGLGVNESETDITDTIKFLKFPLTLNEAPPLKTGMVVFHPAGGHEKEAQFELIHDTPTPFTLNYVVQDLDVNA